jgi:hypothetical protein
MIGYVQYHVTFQVFTRRKAKIKKKKITNGGGHINTTKRNSRGKGSYATTENQLCLECYEILYNRSYIVEIPVNVEQFPAALTDA